MDRIENMSAKEKVKLISSLFKTYQPMLNIVEQVALLTTWIESCVEREEYEMANALTKELKYIQKHPGKVKQRLEGELNKEVLMNNPLSNRDSTNTELPPLKEKKKPSIFTLIVNWFKNIF